ncbi:MAG: adenylate/guanylate cyclase domain-containing protein [Mariprofundaceae bacterium]
MPTQPPVTSNISASGLFRKLLTIFLSSTAASMAIGIPFYIFGLELTTEQMRIAAVLIVPVTVLATFLTGYFVLTRDFRPLHSFLDKPLKDPDNDISANALILALNFPLLSARRVLLFQGSAFASVIVTLILLANRFLEFDLHLWQIVVAMMAAFMVAIGHAMFEYYAVSNMMIPIIIRIKKQCAKLSSSQRKQVVTINMKRKLLLVSGLVVFIPLLVLGFTLLIKFQYELAMLGFAEELSFMPKMIGWTILIIAGGSGISLMISMRMAHEITGSANALSKAMLDVKEGSLDTSLVATSTDEFANIFEHFNRMVEGLREKERLRDAFGRYVAKEIAEDVMHHGVSLGGKEVNASVLFADIRDFTALSEEMSPADVVTLLNEYFSAVEPTIKAEEGWINKFGGDSLLAVFGVHTAQDDHASRAVRAALKMRASLASFNVDQKKQGHPVLKIGIGIHCGKMVAGSVGSQERMEFTVIGDTVNMASRIEELNKNWDTDILVSEDIRGELGKEIQAETMPPTRVHGISKPIQVFAIRE